MLRFITNQLYRFIKHMSPNQKLLLGRWGSVKNNHKSISQCNEYYYDCANEFKN